MVISEANLADAQPRRRAMFLSTLAVMLLRR
jgi:hypothetical protein